MFDQEGLGLGCEHLFYFHTYLRFGELPVEKPAIVGCVVNKQRGGYPARPTGVYFWTEIIRIRLVKPANAGGEVALFRKVGDADRKICWQIETDQQQFYFLALVLVDGILKIGDLFYTGYAKGGPEVDNKGMIAVGNI